MLRGQSLSRQTQFVKSLISAGRSLHHYFSYHIRVNSTVVWICTSNSKRSGETTATTNITTIKTIVIGRDGMSHVIGIIPCDLSSHGHSNVSW